MLNSGLCKPYQVFGSTYPFSECQVVQYLPSPPPEKIFSQLNPLHPNNSIHILLTDLSTFPVVMTRRICLTIRSFLNWDSFTLFSWPKHFIQGWYCKEKLGARHSYALKGELQLCNCGKLIKHFNQVWGLLAEFQFALLFLNLCPYNVYCFFVGAEYMIISLKFMCTLCL